MSDESSNFERFSTLWDQISERNQFDIWPDSPSVDGVVVTCPYGAKNRVGHRGQGVYKCGKCKLPVPNSVINAEFRKKLSLR